jgi:hypothetical protein
VRVELAQSYAPFKPKEYEIHPKHRGDPLEDFKQEKLPFSFWENYSGHTMENNLKRAELEYSL